MGFVLDVPGLVVVGAATASDALCLQFSEVLPLPAQVTVLVAVQQDGPGVVEMLDRAGFRIARDAQPLLGGIWIAPAGAALRVDGPALRLRPRNEARRPVEELFASARPRRPLGLLLGDLGAEGEAAARTFGDGPLLRPDLHALPGRATLRV